MITIVDYGMGNLRSVAKGFERVGVPVRVTQKPREVEEASKVVLPGVGAFQDAMRYLEQLRLKEPVLKFIASGRPFLGICLGLQLLFTESEEGGTHRGFDILPGRVKRFTNNTLKVPHIGWNRIRKSEITPRRPECPLLQGIPDGSYFYFVHSYYAEPTDPAWVVTKTEYGLSFTSMIWKENLFATQFHPEKSQRLGLLILENFARI